jgi:hypothetical protein
MQIRRDINFRRATVAQFCRRSRFDNRLIASSPARHPSSARLVPDLLRRYAVGAKKGTSHSVAIPESGLLRDDVNGVVGIPHQRARRLQSEVLDRCTTGWSWTCR